MELRDHPLMSYRGVSNWPPVWTRTDEKIFSTLKGELGILKHAVLHEHLPSRCFLLIEHEKRIYTGCLLFDEATVCEQVHAVCCCTAMHQNAAGPTSTYSAVDAVQAHSSTEAAVSDKISAVSNRRFRRRITSAAWKKPLSP